MQIIKEAQSNGEFTETFVEKLKLKVNNFK